MHHFYEGFAGPRKFVVKCGMSHNLETCNQGSTVAEYTSNKIQCTLYIVKLTRPRKNLYCKGALLYE